MATFLLYFFETFGARAASYSLLNWSFPFNYSFKYRVLFLVLSLLLTLTLKMSIKRI